MFDFELMTGEINGMDVFDDYNSMLEDELPPKLLEKLERMRNMTGDEWMLKNGNVIKIKDMGDNHLINAINKVEEKIGKDSNIYSVLLEEIERREHKAYEKPCQFCNETMKVSKSPKYDGYGGDEYHFVIGYNFQLSCSCGATGPIFKTTNRY